jgi:hypothetical protein
MEFKTPPQLEDGYKLMSDEECIRKRDAIIASATELAAPLLKRLAEDAQIAKLKAQMEADKNEANKARAVPA